MQLSFVFSKKQKLPVKMLLQHELSNAVTEANSAMSFFPTVADEDGPTGNLGLFAPSKNMISSISTIRAMDWDCMYHSRIERLEE